jgi:phosphoadenylyl-sulfate reductase (thioredoxin)
MRWASETLGRVVFTTGFGVEGCVLIDLIARNQLPIDLITLDTGLLFEETHDLWQRLETRYGVKIRAVTPAETVAEQEQSHGPRLWERDPDRCCGLRKVEPLKRAVTGYAGWITAIRADQTSERKNARVVEQDAKFNLVKVNPLLRWSREDVWTYVKLNEVPYHALHDRGYPSVGCWPCTSAVAEGEDPRAGRWRGRDKKECGLHVREGSKS